MLSGFADSRGPTAMFEWEERYYSFRRPVYLSGKGWFCLMALIINTMQESPILLHIFEPGIREQIGTSPSDQWHMVWTTEYTNRALPQDGRPNVFSES